MNERRIRRDLEGGGNILSEEISFIYGEGFRRNMKNLNHDIVSRSGVEKAPLE